MVGSSFGGSEFHSAGKRIVQHFLCMIHPNLGKYDIPKKKFYRIIIIVSLITIAVVTAVLWSLESGMV